MSQGNQAAAAAGNNVNQGTEETASARLPPWKGNGKDTTTVDLWIDQVERMKTQKGWNSARTAAAVCDALRENAARWMAVVKANPSKREILEDWDNLRPALTKRFADSLTAAQKQAFVRGLVQATSESVQDFFDRVASALSKVHQNHRDALPGAEVNGQKKGYDKSLDVTLGTLFVSGLKNELREYVECNMKDNADSEQLLDLAVKSESSKGHGATAASLKLAAIDSEGQEQTDDMKKMTEELVALKSRLNTFTAGQKGQGKGRATSTPLPPFNERTTWFYCYKCKQHGLHVSRECKLTEDQRKALAPQPRFPIPTTTPTDSQFPNGL